MAELRSAESRLVDIAERYQRIGSHERLQGIIFPSLRSRELVDNDDKKNDNDKNNNMNINNKNTTDPETISTTTTTTTTTETTPQQSFSDLLSELETLRFDVDQLRPTMERFRKRLAEKDPVTGKSRYGEKTQVRVSHLLSLYKELEEAIIWIFGDSSSSSKVDQEQDGSITSTSAPAVASTTSGTPFNPLIQDIRNQAHREKSEAAEMKRLEELEQQQRRERRARQEREQLEEQQRKAEEIKRLQLQQQQELRRQQEETRQAEQRQREAAEQEDRDWENSITKGIDGVKEQLHVLLESTSGDEPTQRAAVQALHVIFSQICAHPEEPGFRRIRRNHPKFNNDIGRHAGGKELLIASGFQLGEIDGVPSFLSKEPDLESHMDKWSSWFDLLKATLSVLEEQVKGK